MALCQVEGFDPKLLLIVSVAASLTGPARAQETQEPQPQPTEEQQAINVTVRGARLRPPISTREPTAASTVLSGETLRSPGTNTADVLSRAPGVQVSRTGSSADLATASIRGATSAQTPVLLAGIPLNDDVAGTADLSSLPLWMIDRVEVYRGHAPGFAGPLGIGGAVLLEPRLPKQTSLGAGQAVGSFGELSSWIAGSVLANGSSSLVGLRHSRAKNDYHYLDDAGTRFDTSDDVRRTRENADFVANDAWAIGRHDLGSRGDLTLVANAFDREQGVTGLSVVPARHARAQVRRFLGGITTRTPCAPPEHGERESPCRLTLSSSAVVAHTGLHDPFGELSMQTAYLSNDATRFIQQAGIEHRIHDVHLVSLHGSQASERLVVGPSAGAGLRALRNTSRITGTSTVQVGSGVVLHAILAAECHTTVGPERSGVCGVLEPSGRLGMRWAALPWLSFFGNAGRYVRPPTLGELYGTSPVVRGTSTLTAERGTSFDVGVRATRRGSHPDDLAGYVEAFVFQRRVADLVAFRRSSFGTIRPFNVGAARITGAEVAGGALWLDHVVNELAITLLDPRDTSEERVVANDILPYRSRLVIDKRVEIFAEPAVQSIRLDRVALGARVHHRSSRFADPAGLIVIAPHTTFDLELSGQFLERSLTGRFALRNLFDASQFDTVGYPLPGRSYHASVEAWF